MQNATQGTGAYVAFQVQNSNASGNSWYEKQIHTFEGQQMLSPYTVKDRYARLWRMINILVDYAWAVSCASNTYWVP